MWIKIVRFIKPPAVNKRKDGSFRKLDFRLIPEASAGISTPFESGTRIALRKSEAKIPNAS